MDELRKIDLNLLLTLHALLTEKHVTRAALRLHRSQPAVSHALAQLRDHFDDPLLIRKSGKMTLSARAHTLLPPLEASLYGLNNLVGSPVFDPSDAKRRFRIAMSDYAARIVLPSLLVYLREHAPGFDLAISQASREMMLEQLENGEVDLALGIFPGAAGKIQKETLFPEEFICLADRRFLPENGKLSFDEWLAKPHVMLGMLPDAVDEIEKALIARGLKRHICVALPHWSAAVSLLPGTDLVLTVASRSVTPERYHEALCRFEPPLQLSGFNYEQAWHIRKNTDPAHEWLRSAIMMSCESFR
ncbi:LysR family transcriptional regulator [Xenorhabdus szentirmaii]|uniref:LysR family transcriptional regulator n=1 Tax=Xenorhabdus szentirmaii TaxID=290112 RepID=A0AAW3YPE4_9GAMM|nr:MULTISPECIES: LysR family transcriptional regulator [unclassified Xenorhabdus]MBD2782386.1 LysR family transcriptional regulator [Xenorhabdus sp. 38]MBD2799422.1 LysR family transcriptional regulator [Xenorhabdus sp. M]